MSRPSICSVFVLASSLVGPAVLVGCTDEDTPPPTPTELVIDTDTSWSGEVTLELPTYVVGGATLSIAPGTVIKGESGSVLVITTEGRLDAEGTVAQPIVFTSAKATPVSGDWGGVVMLGTSGINADGGNLTVEGFAAGTDVARIQYGGGANPDDGHDCGTLRYARIEYAGYALNQDNELNGLTLAGCGTGTVIDYVQIHRGLDDGLEIFGGRVDIRHVVVTLAQDDGLDWDMGWTGTAQHLIVQQSATRGNRGIEADSNADAPDTAMPRSAPTLWNVTLIGGGAGGVDQGGMHLRRGTAGRIHNAVVTNFKTYAVDIDSAASEAAFADGSLAIETTFFHNNAGVGPLWSAEFDDDAFDEEAELSAKTSNVMGTDPEIVDATNLTAPVFGVLASSPVMACGTPPGGFDVTATYCGAVGTDDWTAGWTSYPE
ncbi:MAG: hypothetical protein R2939_15745 [Kofleriaceae bacterium]